MQHDITLRSLEDASDATWKFATPSLARLCERGGPVAIRVYGSVKEAYLYSTTCDAAPSITIDLWCSEDAERAAVLFNEPGIGECMTT